MIILGKVTPDESNLIRRIATIVMVYHYFFGWSNRIFIPDAFNAIQVHGVMNYCLGRCMGDKMNSKFAREYLKYTGQEYQGSFKNIIKVRTSHTLTFLYYGRCMEFTTSKLLKKYYRIRCKLIGTKFGNEIPSFDRIDEGLMLCHGYGITVNENAILGRDVTLFKGCTVGGGKKWKKGRSSHYWKPGCTLL